MSGDLEKKDTVTLLEEQRDLEARLISLYNDSVGRVENPMGRTLLRMLELDSRKHLEICNAALKMIQGEEFTSSEKEPVFQQLEEHIRLEKEAYERANRIMQDPTIRRNPGLSSLIERLRYDERTHHNILMNITKRPFKELNLMDLRNLFRRPE
jgi:hypothetical protein